MAGTNGKDRLDSAEGCIINLDILFRECRFDLMLGEFVEDMVGCLILYEMY